MTLRPELLHTHERAKTADRSYRADRRFIVSKHLLLTVFHELVPVFSPLLTGGNATDFLLNDHIEVFLLLLCLSVER
jgi:hypothetical protein